MVVRVEIKNQLRISIIFQILREKFFIFEINFPFKIEIFQCGIMGWLYCSIPYDTCLGINRSFEMIFGENGKLSEKMEN